MRSSTLLGVWVLSMVCLYPLAAHAQTTLTFENLSNPSNATGINLQGSSVTQNGFILTDTSGQNLISVAPGASSFVYTGSVALFGGGANDTLSLRQAGGASFSLISIDAGNVFPQPTAPSSAVFVTFVGNLLGGGAVTQSFSTNPLVGLNTFTFGSNFTNLTSVSFSGTSIGTGIAEQAQFDNIRVTPVPEPGSVALLVGTGVTGAGFLVRRSRERSASRRKLACKVA